MSAELFLHHVFFDRFGVVGGCLALDKGYRACGARGQAVAEPVAVVVAHELGFAVDHGYRALMAGGGASSAAVAFFFVNMDYSALHKNSSERKICFFLT